MSKSLDALQQQLKHIQTKFSDIEHAYKDLQSRFEYIDKLYAISLEFGAVIDFEHLLGLTKKLFSQQIPVGNFYLYRFDTGKNSLHPLYRSDNKQDETPIMSEGIKDFIKSVIEEKQYLYIANFNNSQGIGLHIEAKGSLLCFPLMADEVHIAGLIILQREKSNAFPNDEINLLDKVSEHMAFALNKTLLYEHTKALSITDSLTGIYNRRHFAQRFEWELQRSKRYNHSVSLMMLDIDHFKRYNDLNGHLKGDLILIQVAEILSAQLREADIIARYGGEEFIILLPETTREQAAKVAEKLRKKIEREKFELAEQQPDGKITASLGIASYPADSTEPETLIHLADQALYAAKSRGRNCVVDYSSMVS